MFSRAAWQTRCIILALNHTEVTPKDSEILGKSSAVFLLAMQTSHKVLHSTIKTSSVRNKRVSHSVVEENRNHRLLLQNGNVGFALIWFCLVFYRFNRLIIYCQIQILLEFSFVCMPVHIILCKKDTHSLNSELEMKEQTA